MSPVSILDTQPCRCKSPRTNRDATAGAPTAPPRPPLNRFDAGNLSVAEWTGKHKDIRLLYGAMCKHRSTERRGTLLRYAKLPEATVVRIIKCPGHGRSVEA